MGFMTFKLYLLDSERFILATKELFLLLYAWITEVILLLSSKRDKIFQEFELKGTLLKPVMLSRGGGGGFMGSRLKDLAKRFLRFAVAE